jgi:hypothetical protein
MKAAFSFQLQGYQPAYRDAVISLVHEATGQTIERKAFLDGSLVVRDLEPGFYEVAVSHPNLVNVIEKRRVRLFPQPAPTKIFVPIPENIFRDSPIRDIPDADVAPVQQISSSVSASIGPIGNKQPGEAILASDWNLMATAVQDLANAVLELTKLVSPKGHDHLEIAEKIDEVQGNIVRFSEAFGRSLLELRREVETAKLRRKVNEDIVTRDPTRGQQILDRIDELELLIHEPTINYTRKLNSVSNLIVRDIQDIAVEQGDAADEFLAEPGVIELNERAQQHIAAGASIKPEQELRMYEQADKKIIGAVGKHVGVFGG